MFCDDHAFGHALTMASGCGYMRDIGQYSNREKAKLVLYKYKYYCLKRGVFFWKKRVPPETTHVIQKEHGRCHTLKT